MNDEKTKEQRNGIALEYELDESPQKVWRAISIPEFRESWLPKDALADPEATSVTPGKEVRYRMRDDAPPFLESTVTFRIAPNAAGGTSLRIIHQLTDMRFDRTTRTAENNNSPTLMLAA
ncbi:SRPBCC domain-containing protein [Rhizobium sp.]|uniref:SRPBCC domain-containing protein n=1 Tax=Rhizobium sp. TaxID=391 RepID=UPI002F002EFA